MLLSCLFYINVGDQANYILSYLKPLDKITYMYIYGEEK